MTNMVALGPLRATLVKAGVGAGAAAAALLSYGAYGDPHADSSQKSAVPFLIGVAVVISAAVFGLLVPRALRAIAAGPPSATRWSLGFGIASVLLLAVFWTGAPLIVGTAAILLAAAGRQRARAGVTAYTATMCLAGGAIALSVVWTVLTNAGVL